MSFKFKILCLHGYRQNAIKFKAQIGALRKLLKNEAEFYFLSAPHKIPYTDIQEGDEEEQRGWWFTKPSSFSSMDESDIDTGLQESLAEIKKFFQERGPFHGILGFSQGAALTGILCALRKNEMVLDFQFVIIICGFKSRCILHKRYYEEKININSLHIIGETDQIITSDMSHELAEVFVNPVILVHPGGHFVPGRSVYRKTYVDFLAAQKRD